MKKIISVFLVLSLVLCCGLYPVSAASTSNVVNRVVYDEITSAEDLLAIAAQEFSSVSTYSRSSGNDTVEVKFDGDVLVVRQLLSDTTYANGESEKEYVENTVAVVDEKYDFVTAAYVDSTLTHEEYGANTLGTLMVLSKMYLIARDLGNAMSYRFKQGSTTLTQNNTGNAYNVTMYASLYYKLGIEYDDTAYATSTYQSVTTNCEYVVTVPSTEFYALSEFILFRLETMVTNTSGATVVSLDHLFDGTTFS